MLQRAVLCRIMIKYYSVFYGKKRPMKQLCYHHPQSGQASEHLKAQEINGHSVNITQFYSYLSITFSSLSVIPSSNAKLSNHLKQDHLAWVSAGWEIVHGTTIWGVWQVLGVTFRLSEVLCICGFRSMWKLGRKQILNVESYNVKFISFLENIHQQPNINIYFNKNKSSIWDQSRGRVVGGSDAYLPQLW